MAGQRKRPARVVMAYPTRGHDLSCRFFTSWQRFDRLDQQRHGGRLLEDVISWEMPHTLAIGRNKLAAMFLDDYRRADWLWFCDTDIEFPPDTLERLVASAAAVDATIMSATYAWLDTDDAPRLAVYVDDPEYVLRTANVWTPGPVQAAAVGFGCVIVHRRVLEDMRQAVDRPHRPHAWFGFDLIPNDAGELFPASEDTTFCLRARAVGHPTWVDTSVHVGHHKGSRTWWPEDVQRAALAGRLRP